MATVTRNEFDAAFGRRSQEDHKRIMEALAADGTITIVEGDEIVDPPPLLDAEGNEVKDEEGNTVMAAPEPYHSDALLIEVDKETEAVEIPEDVDIQLPPGTQNVAFPFPEEAGD